MQLPPQPHNETERLQALTSSGLLNNLADEGFDRFTRLAQALFGCKISLFTLIDEQKQWFKSRQGTALKETPRDVSFCAHAIFNDDILYVPDASLDQRFADNPLVTGAPAIRLYAGIPLHSPQGFPLGTLCIIDDIPRELNALQLTSLQDLAALAETEIAIRFNQLAQQRKQLELQAADNTIKRLQSIIDTSLLATWEWNVQTGDVIFNERWAQQLGYALYELLPLHFDTWVQLVHPEDRIKAEQLLQRHFAGELEHYKLHCRMKHKDGHWVSILTQGRLVSRTEQGAPRLMAGTHQPVAENTDQ
ncbi:PAS domain-containing protein [Rheinheimera muenzenbergensis]|uniref:PAS domain-containing protein n=1 Tax=Rheinheimera muenzenbergensis TaxID=1193628 RepID=A0ABU8C3Q1_9GAMM